MKNEIDFNSEDNPLKNELANTDSVEIYYKLTKRAFKKQPDSLYWKQAFGLIEKRYLKLQNKTKA